MGVRNRRLGSRRVTLGDGVAGWDDQPKGPCRVCGAETYGMPSEPWLTFGPRTAEYVQSGRVWVCNGAECFKTFDDLLDLDEADQAARREQVAEATGNAQDGPMPDNDNPSPMDDIRRNLLGFAAHTTRQTIYTAIHESASVYQLARGAIQRTFWASAYGAIGAAVGAASGFLIGPHRAQRNDHREESRQAVLQRRVSATQVIRTILPSLEQQLTTMEYDARKELEHMGYYPCEDCGVPHVKEEPHQMPPGTYWSEADNAYIRPGDPKWTKEGYESTAGERWDLSDDGSDGSDDGQVH
jgi:hypothetical protein